MADREKLLELMCEAKKADTEDAPFCEFLADFLIANGVTIPVRCKDCKTSRKYHQPAGHRYCLHHERRKRDNDFCSRGERKE